jgi:hypothetical protein
MFFKKNLIFVFVNKQILITQKTQKIVEQQQDISTGLLFFFFDI